MNKYKCPNCKEEQFGNNGQSCCFACKTRLLCEDIVPVSAEHMAQMDSALDRDRLWSFAIMDAKLPMDQIQKVLASFNRLRPEPTASTYFCLRCGYRGDTALHDNCNYEASMLKGKPQTETP